MINFNFFALRAFVGVYFSLGILGSLWGGVRLPLKTLRDQGTTAHCWAYSMSHLLESRALSRENLDVMIEVERDVKFWVDFERMHYIHQSKKDFFLDDYEGGWQIEFFETLIKHGKSLARSAASATSDIVYPLFQNFNIHLPFENISRVAADASLSFPRAKERLLSNEFSDFASADIFIRDFLTAKYGEAQVRTTFLSEEIAIKESASKILGSDFSQESTVNDFVLVKPVSDANVGWVKYLESRYWGYRMDRRQLPLMVRRSLDGNWPVTFDNVGHAMTVVGYGRPSENPDSAYEYAVADSIPGKITWYTEAQLLNNFNLVTFRATAVSADIPARGPHTLALFPPDFNIDAHDKTQIPPGTSL